MCLPTTFILVDEGKLYFQKDVEKFQGERKKGEGKHYTLFIRVLFENDAVKCYSAIKFYQFAGYFQLGTVAT